MGSERNFLFLFLFWVIVFLGKVYYNGIMRGVVNEKKETSIKRNKRAFTLVELLAVIAIVAILSVVTIPMVMKYIQSSAQKGFAQSVYHAMDAIREDLAADDFKQFPDEGLAASELAGLDRNPFIGGNVFYP